MTASVAVVSRLQVLASRVSNPSPVLTLSAKAAAQCRPVEIKPATMVCDASMRAVQRPGAVTAASKAVSTLAVYEEQQQEGGDNDEHQARVASGNHATNTEAGLERPLFWRWSGPGAGFGAGSWREAAAMHGAVDTGPRLCVAPMMDWTDNHFRTLCRLLTRRTWLYTEMVVDQTLVHNPDKASARFLSFPEGQGPIVLQLGGSNPATLAQACRIAQDFGYDEINLNCGCPSDRVAGHGCFGAKLMTDPGLVAECTAAMAAATNIPITVKCRIGVDDMETYEELCNFIETVSTRSPVRHFIIHARKAFLKGLSPAENRTKPPLKHEFVYALLRDFPHLQFTLNGVVPDCYEALDHLRRGAHGVMLGRAAYQTPWLALADADRSIYGCENPATSRRQVLRDYAAYANAVKEGWSTHPPSIRVLIKPLLDLFYCEPRARRWRNAIDKVLKERENNIPFDELLDIALCELPDEVLDAPPPHKGTKPAPVLRELPVTPEWVQQRHVLHGTALGSSGVGNMDSGNGSFALPRLAEVASS
eukprot:jgi/Chlat1/1361/Chrsp119S01759